MNTCNATHDDGGYRRLAHLNGAAGCGQHRVTCTLAAGHAGEHRDETHAGEPFSSVPAWIDGAPIPPYTLMAPIPA